MKQISYPPQKGVLHLKGAKIISGTHLREVSQGWNFSVTEAACHEAKTENYIKTGERK